MWFIDTVFMFSSVSNDILQLLVVKCEIILLASSISNDAFLTFKFKWKSEVDHIVSNHVD